MQRLTEIKSRIKSVSDTRKITGAMETISVAKARKATDAAEANAPLFEKIRLLAARALHGSEYRDTPYCQPPKKDAETLFLVIASNKGLAGGFNANILKRALSMLSEVANHTIFTVGYEAYDFFTHRGMIIEQDFSDRAAVPDMSLANEIADELYRQFACKKVGHIVMLYTRMLNSSAQEVAEVSLFPIVPTTHMAVVTEFDPSPDEALSKLIPTYLLWSVYGALLQSAAAEHHARRVAMNSAGRNAGELLDELTRQFNSARQASVTTELNEIVATGMGVRKT